MNDRSLKLAGKLNQLGMSPCATCAAKDGDLLRSIQKVRKDVEFFFGGTNRGLRSWKCTRG